MTMLQCCTIGVLLYLTLRLHSRYCIVGKKGGGKGCRMYMMCMYARVCTCTSLCTLALYPTPRHPFTPLYTHPNTQASDPERARQCLSAAARKYELSLEHQPTNPQALNNWGLVLRELSLTRPLQEAMPYLRAAVAKFRRALRVNPEFDRACYNLGTVLFNHASMLQNDSSNAASWAVIQVGVWCVCVWCAWCVGGVRVGEIGGGWWVFSPRCIANGVSSYGKLCQL